MQYNTNDRTPVTILIYSYHRGRDRMVNGTVIYVRSVSITSNAC